VDAQTDNTLTASLVHPAVGQNFAYAGFSLAAVPGLATQGKIRGRWVVPADNHLAAVGPFFSLNTSTGTPIIQLSFDNTFALQCFSAAGTLSPSAVGADFSTTRLPPGNLYSVEVQWKKGTSRVVTVAGTPILTAALDPLADTAVVGDLRLGILPSEASQSAWTDTLFDWEICDDPTVPW
jgi:hypothetical protein